MCAQHNNIIQHLMLLMPLLCHLAMWKLDKTTFGFADKNRAELQELVTQPEPKKQRLELVARMATRSQAQEGVALPQDLKKQQEQEAVEKWRQIVEQHQQDKEVEGR